RLRYFAAMKLSQRVAHERLTRVCFNDYDRELALVAEWEGGAGAGGPEIVGVARLSKLPWRSEAEFALLVADQWQGKGIGTQLLSMLVRVARDEGLARLYADILPENMEMQRLCKKVGFEVRWNDEQGTCQAEMRFA